MVRRHSLIAIPRHKHDLCPMAGFHEVEIICGLICFWLKCLRCGRTLYRGPEPMKERRAVTRPDEVVIPKWA